MPSADLLLHPVRLRVLQTFLGDRALTTSQLRSELPDVPPASLYRHVGRLVDGGVLSVVSERRVRGFVERRYVLRSSAATVDLDEVAKMGPDEHREMFMAFIAGVLGDFDRYLSKGEVDLVRDGVSYRLTGMWLTAEERAELAHDLVTVLQPRLANAPKRGRKRWFLGTIVIPGEEAPDLEETAG